MVRRLGCEGYAKERCLMNASGAFKRAIGIGIAAAGLGLSPAALVIATSLQRYGAVIGDQSGGPAALKVENTVAEGRGWLWSGILGADSLRAIPLSAFEVIVQGWRP